MKKEEKRGSHKYQSMGMCLGMCFGISIGMAIGYAAFDNGPIGMCFGLSIGMMFGMALGTHRDQVINKQLEEKGYTILEIQPQADSAEEMDVKLSDKNDEIRVVTLSKKEMKADNFAVGDLVYLNEEGRIEQVLDKT